MATTGTPMGSLPTGGETVVESDPGWLLYRITRAAPAEAALNALV